MFSKPKITEVGETTLIVKDLNDVYSETNGITNKFLSLPVPGTPTTGTRVSNLFGKLRTINIQGRHYGDGYSETNAVDRINAFITEVEAWINILGLQQRKQYHSIFGNTYKVVCNTFSYQWRETTPVHIEYTMQLIEGGNFTNDLVNDLIGV